jgi:2-phosphosulfolactate phosphatase
MQIRILKMLEGAREADGLTVVIDVFRAFSVEAYLLAGGAERVIPVGDAALAYRLKEENPDYLLVGERGGRMMEGFDAGNSPSQMKNLDVRGKTVVHTTSAGTQGIASAVGAERILGGALVNAAATAEYIKRSGASRVSLVAMGLAGISPTEEDDLCAAYMKSCIEENPMPPTEENIAVLKATSGAKFFDPMQSEVFPTADFEMCVKADIFDFAMELVSTGEELPYMKKLRSNSYED